MKYGDIDLVGRIYNFKVELLDSQPEDSEIARMYFNSELDLLQVVTAAGVKNIMVSSTGMEPIIDVLGGWFNPDYSFNPTPFNDLDNINELTATDTLFDVVVQLDAAITANKISVLSDIGNYTEAEPQAGDIIFFNGTEYAHGSLANIPNLTITMDLADVGGVSLSVDPDGGDLLIFDLDAGVFINKKVWFKYENLSPATTHVVEHNLNTRHCFVQVIDAETHNSIVPTSIEFSDANTLSVTLSEAKSTYILVHAPSV